LETGIISQIGARVYEDGAVTVPAKNLLDWVKTMPDERMDLSLDAKTQVLTIQCGGKSASFKGIDAQEFPVFPDVPNGGTMADGKEMRELIADLLKVKHTAQEAYRNPFVECVKINGGEFTALNHAQVTKHIQTWTGAEPIRGYILKSSLAALGRIIVQEGRKNVEMIHAGQTAAFKVEQTTLFAKYQEVEFPQLIESEITGTCTVDAEDLIKDLKIAAAFSDKVKMKVNGSISLTAEQDENTFATQVPCGHTGKDFEFQANIKTALSALGKKRGLIVIGHSAERVTITAGEDTALMATVKE
jgi:DNA polymerase-3 subunit beta